MHSNSSLWVDTRAQARPLSLGSSYETLPFITASHWDPEATKLDRLISPALHAGVRLNSGVSGFALPSVSTSARSTVCAIGVLCLQKCQQFFTQGNDNFRFEAI